MKLFIPFLLFLSACSSAKTARLINYTCMAYPKSGGTIKMEIYSYSLNRAREEATQVYNSLVGQKLVSQDYTMSCEQDGAV